MLTELGAVTPVVVHVGGGVSAWVTALISAGGTLVGALGGVIVSARHTRALAAQQAEQDRIRRAQDTRLQAYGDALAWFFDLRSKIENMKSYVEVASEGDVRMDNPVNQSWFEVVRATANEMPTVMTPVLRVASDAVIASYKELIANATFWDITFGPLGPGLGRDADVAERLRRVNFYLEQLDTLIHMFRREVGLTSGNDLSYLNPLAHLGTCQGL